MTDEVGRIRCGRESRAHGSARRELVNVDKIQSRAKGKRAIVAGETQAQQEEPEPEYEEELEDGIKAGVEEQQEEDDLSDFFDFEDEEEEQEEQQELEAQPQPPQKQQRKKNTRTTQGRNPPRAGEARVTSYGGGPTDLCLLPGFGKHVVASLWRGECKKRYLRCTNNGKRINDFTLPSSELKWFWDVVIASGLRPLLKTNYNNLDWGLLTVFTERRHPETGTFHLSIGEVTITLDDVSCLLHIPITGQISKKMKGAHIGFPMLKKIYAANLRRALKAERDRESEEVVLDLRLVNTWNWGASGLAYLYHYLEKASRPRCGNHGGYNCMFQDPICAKYCPLKGYKYSDEHRTTLDMMEVDEVTFRPYEDHRHRVLGQFGHVQSIPRHPNKSAKAGLNWFTIVEAFANYMAKNYVTEEMRGPRAHNGYGHQLKGMARPANLEVMIEEDNAADKQEVFQICRTVIMEVKGKLDGELTLEEAREVLKKVVSDLEPVATYSLPVKRKRDSGEGRKKSKKKKKSTEAGPNN
ncbi:hypothetical protein TSUD_391770 [Trifolium subterraneum]|uniref:Aminotransferase-like plant mobile domain-containing protein n=1 Tax=Trifolium subterraneum TaxID=3900 RepID=A0A2Z6NBD7_TRISU|nr:hypothetical protein TSUD_391770 [Trifolium subterraneum]